VSIEWAALFKLGLIQTEPPFTIVPVNRRKKTVLPIRVRIYWIKCPEILRPLRRECPSACKSTPQSCSDAIPPSPNFATMTSARSDETCGSQRQAGSGQRFAYPRGVGPSPQSFGLPHFADKLHSCQAQSGVSAVFEQGRQTAARASVERLSSPQGHVQFHDVNPWGLVRNPSGSRHQQEFAHR